MQLMVGEFLAEVPEIARNIPGTIDLKEKLLILDFTTQRDALAFGDRHCVCIFKAIESNPDLLKLANKVRLQHNYGAQAFTLPL